MKYISKILSLSTVLLLTITFQPAAAQSDIDTNSMFRDIHTNPVYRDIEIMEGVLEKLFKFEAMGTFGGGVIIRPKDKIRGKYIPDYGVIFTIPYQQPPGGKKTEVLDKQGEVIKEEHVPFSFRYDDYSSKEITEESITNRIIEFLKNYGPLIGQLSENQYVTVIYQNNTSNRIIDIAKFRSKDQSKEDQLIPTISVTANAQDLKAYRLGKINDTAFRNQLNIKSIDTSSKKEKDLKIMANILETTFENNGEQKFHIHGTVDYLKLDNFGVLFSFSARYDMQTPFDFSDVQKSIEVLKRDGEEKEIEVSIDSLISKKRKARQKFMRNQNQKKSEAYNEFLSDLKSTIADYGGTLNSIDSNQKIFVSVALNSSFNLDLEVSKSAFENNSREEIIDQINARKRLKESYY